MAACGGVIEDYRGVDKSSHTYPLIAVTTTAGTGSECTMDYVVVDEEKNEKYGNCDRNVLPVLAVDDCGLMMNMPANLTAGTGMDALTHAVEAYVSVDGALITSELAATAGTPGLHAFGACSAEQPDEGVPGGNGSGPVYRGPGLRKRGLWPDPLHVPSTERGV